MIDEKHMEWIELDLIRKSYWFELGDSFPHWKADWILTLAQIQEGTALATLSRKCN